MDGGCGGGGGPECVLAGSWRLGLGVGLPGGQFLSGQFAVDRVADAGGGGVFRVDEAGSEPEAVISGPPLLPGLIDASVSMRSRRPVPSI